MYRILYRKSAQKTLSRMLSLIAQRFREAFGWLAENPARRDLNVRSLEGREGFRLRVGDWRAIYRVEEGRLMILVIDIGPTGDVYK